MKRFFKLAGKIILWAISIYILLVINAVLIMRILKPNPPFPIGILSLVLALLEARLLYVLYKKRLKEQFR